MGRCLRTNSDQASFFEIEIAHGNSLKRRQITQRVLLDDDPLNSGLDCSLYRVPHAYDAGSDGSELAALGQTVKVLHVVMAAERDAFFRQLRPGHVVKLRIRQNRLAGIAGRPPDGRARRLECLNQVGYHE